MKESSMARTASAIVVAIAALGSSFAAQAQIANSIFPAGFESKVRDRLFMRLGYTMSFIKTKSEAAKDITGNVVSKEELHNAFLLGQAISVDCDTTDPSYLTERCLRYNDGNGGSNYLFMDTALVTGGTGGPSNLDVLGMNGLGTPPGIKVKAQKSVGTPTVSVGYWLEDEYKWLIEAYVLAAPLTVKIYGDGVRDDGTPMVINGKHVATSKLLPPLVIGSYHFGDKRSVVRPYVGLGAMYAIFFDGRSTSYFDGYQGGKTTVTTKNTFGFGPFVGLQSNLSDDWHVNLSVGQIKLKATSRLVTSNTNIQSGSDVLADFPRLLADQIVVGEDLWGQSRPDQIGKFTTNLMALVREGRGGKADLGTFVREQKMKLTNTIVTLSVGRSF